MTPLPLVAELNVSTTEFARLSRFQLWNDEGHEPCDALLDVRAGAFPCVEFNFSFDNLPQFVEQLRTAQQQLSGGAELRPDHENCGSLRVAYGSLGHVTVSGRLKQSYPIDGSLEFSFGCGQSFMPPFVEQLQAVADRLAALRRAPAR